MLELLADHAELFKQYIDNLNSKRWLMDMVFDSTSLRRVAAKGSASVGSNSVTTNLCYYDTFKCSASGSEV